MENLVVSEVIYKKVSEFLTPRIFAGIVWLVTQQWFYLSFNHHPSWIYLLSSAAGFPQPLTLLFVPFGAFAADNAVAWPFDILSEIYDPYNPFHHSITWQSLLFCLFYWYSKPVEFLLKLILNRWDFWTITKRRVVKFQALMIIISFQIFKYSGVISGLITPFFRSKHKVTTKWGLQQIMISPN